MKNDKYENFVTKLKSSEPKYKVGQNIYVMDKDIHIHQGTVVFITDALNAEKRKYYCFMKNDPLPGFEYHSCINPAVPLVENNSMKQLHPLNIFTDKDFV